MLQVGTGKRLGTISGFVGPAEEGGTQSGMLLHRILFHMASDFAFINLVLGFSAVICLPMIMIFSPILCFK